MRALPSELRRQLEAAVLAGRRAAEAGVRAALSSLGVQEEDKPAHLDENRAQLRRGLRAKQRQLGGDFEVLLWECAYEQWHRLLFARFLAENGLLQHPEFGAPVTLADCEELAADLGEPDGWSVAGRFAAEILPGIFRLDDPCVQLRLAPEHRVALEKIIAGLPREVFVADDSLGWVYQYWQKERKDRVNASEVKIGGADLGPVTQLFTENYMVRFLLENSLGGWWAARHPDSPLIKEFEYLRFDEDGQPTAGTFDSWPNRVVEVTVMDPCCGSGHFLVEAFGMLWRMRAEEEGLDPVAAQDAVLRDNLFGLELDPRCVQIAMFAVALTAWKQGDGWRELPTPNVACSGIPVKAPLQEWTALAEGDYRLERALERLHTLFKDADTLGSLIDPRRVTELTNAAGLQRSFEDVDFEEISPLLERASTQEVVDPATAVLGADAAGIARAASLLSRSYTLVATNVPYRERRSQSKTLLDFVDRHHNRARFDLATAFVERCMRLSMSQGTSVLVTPQNWLFLGSYRSLRQNLLSNSSLTFISWLGSGAFSEITGEVVNVVLLGTSNLRPGIGEVHFTVDASQAPTPQQKALSLARTPTCRILQSTQEAHPDARVLSEPLQFDVGLGSFVDSLAGMMTSDSLRFVRKFWETPLDDGRWSYLQTTTSTTSFFNGCTDVMLWENGRGIYKSYADRNRARLGGAPLRGRAAWGKKGVAISQMGSLPASLYQGTLFDNNVAVLLPEDESLLPAIWSFCSSKEFVAFVRLIDRKMNVTNATLEKVPFDLERWQKIATERFPTGLPEPWSDDPTQWPFRGAPEVSTEPLQVAVGRLVGFRWPEQPDRVGLDEFKDRDGVVCLPPVAGELPAADRMQALLAQTYGDEWSPGFVQELLNQAGSNKKSLADWLRDEFFKQHCKVFQSRPFVWHIWDGRKDGFSALVNYHRLDRAGLEKLTYTYLGDWIERQRADASEDVAGADVRLTAARGLKAKLEAILEGEPPYDIYVRWKALHEQPIGWNPDLDDGVRLNIRPFVEAGVLRSKVNVHWNKDRGKNPDGSERHNDLHYTRDEKQQARQKARRV